MCYSPDVARIAAELGFKWIIMDEIALGGTFGQARSDVIYSIKEVPDIIAFFKERPFSAGITYGRYPTSQPFLAALGNRLAAEGYLLTGTDGEVYGHHRPGQEKLLEEVFAARALSTCTISELPGLIKNRGKVSPLPCSWSTWQDELAEGIPYPQWKYPGHVLHELQWQLAYLAIELVNAAPKGSGEDEKARRLLDEGLHSDQFWWASCRPWWDTGMIESGARKLLDAISQVQNALPTGKYQQASNLFESIKNTARQWEETGEASRRKERYLVEHKEVTSELTFGKR